jgi:hypothetical protein
MPSDKATHLRATMEKSFPEAEVTGYEPLIAAMPNDVKVITTLNVKDFAPLPDGIEAQLPDEFLCNLFRPSLHQLQPAGVLRALTPPRAGRSPPSSTTASTLRPLEQVSSAFA